MYCTSGGEMWECVFWEYVLCSPSPSLWSSKRCRAPAYTLFRGDSSGPQQVGSQITGYGECTKNTGRRGGSLSLHHSRTQQRQNLWRLPPTEGGGVTGAKYACTLMLGRWVCRGKRTHVIRHEDHTSAQTQVLNLHSCGFVHPASYLKQFKFITWNHNLTQKS